MKEFIDKLISRLEESVQGSKDSKDLSKYSAYKQSISIVNELAEEYKLFGKTEQVKGGWIADRVPTKEECGRYGSKEFQVTIPQSNGNKTVAMDYCYETVKGKEVGRWRWNGKLSPWDVLAWKSMDAPYTEGEAELYRAKSVDGEYQEYKGDWK
jgi:hypothetical protein